jgi:hypothetical protein
MPNRILRLTAMVAVLALAAALALADKVVHPNAGAPGTWRLIGQTHACPILALRPPSSHPLPQRPEALSDPRFHPLDSPKSLNYENQTI